MQIRFEVGGGLAFFPALAGPSTLDSSVLAPAEAARLEALVSDADFFTRAPQPIAARGADIQHYVLTVVDGERSRTLEFRDPIGDAAIDDLISFVRSTAQPVTH